jgi:hypothetical protein
MRFVITALNHKHKQVVCTTGLAPACSQCLALSSIFTCHIAGSVTSMLMIHSIADQRNTQDMGSQCVENIFQRYANRLWCTQLKLKTILDTQSQHYTYNIYT